MTAAYSQPQLSLVSYPPTAAPSSLCFISCFVSMLLHFSASAPCSALCPVQQHQKQQHQLVGPCSWDQPQAFGSSFEVRAALDSCWLFSTQPLCFCLLCCACLRRHLALFLLLFECTFLPCFFTAYKSCVLSTLLLTVCIDLSFTPHVLAAWFPVYGCFA